MAGNRTGSLKRAARWHGMTLEEYQAKAEQGLKFCTRCKSWRPATDFGRDHFRGDGRASTCTPCRRITVRVPTKGRPSAFKGRTHTEEARRRMSEANKGNKRHLGKKHSTETRMKISERLRVSAVRGPANHAYKDGKVAERRGLRHSQEYQRWRFDVFVRDGFACRMCGDRRGGNLNAHHIKSFADHPERRFDVSNGITICETCHARFGCKGGEPPC
jgi:NUMOD3 motif/HNH endonuclease